MGTGLRTVWGSRPVWLARAWALLWLSGCAPAIAAGAGAGVEGSLETLNEKPNQVLLAEIATSPDMQAAVTDIGESLTHGIVNALQDEIGEVAAGDGGDALAAGVGDHTESIIRERVAPGVAEVVARSVEASLATASSEEGLEHTRTIAASAAQAAVRGMTAALAEGIREDIVPALSESDGGLSPMATRLLSDEEFKQAVGALAHEVSREIVLGSEGALDKIQREQDPGSDGNWISNLGAGLTASWAVLVAFVAALAIGFIALVVLLVKGNAQRRHLERDTREREHMVMELMHAVIGERGGLTPAQRERLERAGFGPVGSTPAPSPG
jgi:hypothetical protein